MKRRTFLKSSGVAAAIGFSTQAFAAPKNDPKKKKQLYELRVYELFRSQAPLDQFLSTALIPALNRLGVKHVGVFSEIGKAEPTKIYLLIAYDSFEDYETVLTALKTDAAFQKASETYNQIPADRPLYSRFESHLMISFDGFPTLIVPKNEQRVFELRLYEGYSEDAVRRKIKMFNEEEFPIFDRAKLKPVFFGEAIAGEKLPCIIYMLWTRDLQENTQGWNTFLQDPQWKKIVKAPEYANTVSRIRKTFLEPLPYSQI